MSRLLVKNIPIQATPESLRTHFSSTKNGSLIITDAHVARKPDGTPRRFAFVGFKSDDQARAAKDWFHGTFWGSQRITVEVVQGVKDAPTPRPNKRPRLTGPENGPLSTVGPPANSDEKTLRSKATATGEEDALTKEFLNVMNPKFKKGPAWADGDAPHSVTPAIPQRTEPSLPQVPEGDGFTTQNEGVSDLEWMKSRMTQGIREGKEFDQSDDEGDGDENIRMAEAGPEQAGDVSNEPSDPQEATRQTIISTARLFIRNLTFSCTSEELQELFGRFGQIEQVHIPLTATHTSKGLAFVSYAQPADAVAAWEALDGATFQGRLLHIMAGVQRRQDAVQAQANGKKTLKEERGEKKKREAGREFNWGMLYMNSDAVVSSIADRMSISKAEILGAAEDEGVGSQNPAVKLALAETHVIQETKRYFEDQGVVLASLSTRSTPRSCTTMLVKNIPYGTTSDTLRGLFEPHGEVARLLIPPSGTLAVVEFMHPEEASRAFRGVAYRRLANSIVYLEWAPEGMIVENSGTGDSRTEVKPVTIREQNEGATDSDHTIRSGSTLFVKNLSFTTTTDRLTQVFRRMPSFAFARVQMKPAPPNHRAKAQPDQERLSMGYGFVGFADAEAAQKALKSMQGFVLDGHKLHVTFAGRGADETSEEKKGGLGKAKTAKMIVKNVPFEANKKDIRDLFGVYGTLKSVRLPKKFDARTRGFAFLEFVSRHEAENAFAALRHTHLLGRHLVLDWAAEGEQDVDALRRKVGVGFGGGGEMPGKKRKVEIAMEGEEDEA